MPRIIAPNQSRFVPGRHIKETLSYCGARRRAERTTRAPDRTPLGFEMRTDRLLKKAKGMMPSVGIGTWVSCSLLEFFPTESSLRWLDEHKQALQSDLNTKMPLNNSFFSSHWKWKNNIQNDLRASTRRTGERKAGPLEGIAGPVESFLAVIDGSERKLG